MFWYSLTILGWVPQAAAVQYRLKVSQITAPANPREEEQCKKKNAATEGLDIHVQEDTLCKIHTAHLPCTSSLFRSHWILAAGLLPVVVHVSVIMSPSMAGRVNPVISGRPGIPVFSDEVKWQTFSHYLESSLMAICQGWTRFTLSTSSLWMLQGCLCWHTSSALHGGWGQWTKLGWWYLFLKR